MKIDLKKELELCKKLRRKNGYCYWGVCKFCGVPSFIKKLRTGKVEHEEKNKRLFESVARRKKGDLSQ